MYLPRRDRDLGVILQESAIAKLSNGSHGPAKSSPEHAPGQRNIDDDLLVDGLGTLCHLLQILAAGVADPSSEVDESERGDENIAGMAIAECQSRVSDQMGQAIVSAEETFGGVLVKPLLGLLDGRLQSEGRGGARFVVLQALVEAFHFVLLALCEGLALGARSQSSHISESGVCRAEREGDGQGGSSSGRAELVDGLLALSAA